MNNPDLVAAAKALMLAEPAIGEVFSLAQIEEHLRVLAKRLRIAAALEKVTGT